MSVPTSAVRKVTLALPGELVDFADRQARRGHTNRSQVVSQALAQARAREQERLAVEGYRFYAGEAGEFAEFSSEAVAEAWDEPAGGEWSQSYDR